jgi:phenylacetate-coenzyme A ligase PaaK-like adenylate-forming protein
MPSPTVLCTSLETWAARRSSAEGERFSRERLERYQLEQLQATLAWAALRSPHYHKVLAGVPEGGPATLSEVRALPFTTPEDLPDIEKRAVNKRPPAVAAG